MATFFAAALYYHTRLVETRALRFALLAGAMAGLAFLGKYAAVYFILGVGLGALLVPALRIGLRNAVALLGAFAVVILPNLVWNATNDMTTASHILDNVGWVRDETPLGTLNPGGLAEFFLAQFAVFGPLLFAALLWAAARGQAPRLLVFVVPPLVIVCAQALLDRAYANCAAAAYFAGVVLVVALLLPRPRWLVASLVVNGTIALLLPLATLFPGLALGDGPLLKRYLGREELSLQIIERAQAAGGVPIVADRRDVLADLFYTGRDARLAIYAPRPQGRPQDHYAQSHPLPSGLTGPLLLVTGTPPDCPGDLGAMPLETSGGGYEGLALSTYLVDAACVK
jgi:hypothetical protein